MPTRDNWTLDCDLADGARIGRLRYAGVDLLTTAPADFRPPLLDYGRYETRPVYGYDDCFPTVDPCDDWPDHGELCWLAWAGTATDCHVRSRRWPLTFTRRLEFAAQTLHWHFAVTNEGDQPLAFQHVMHPLMPLDQLRDLELPNRTVAEFLRQTPRGQEKMLFIPSDHFTLIFSQGLRLTVRFSLTRTNSAEIVVPLRLVHVRSASSSAAYPTGARKRMAIRLRITVPTSVRLNRPRALPLSLVWSFNLSS